MEKALYFSIVKGISPCFWTRSPIFSFCTGTHRLRSQTRFQVCPNYCSSSQPLRGLQGLEWWLLHSLPTCCPHIRQPWTCTKIRIFKAGHEVKGLGKLILASFTGTLMDLTVHKILKKPQVYHWRTLWVLVLAMCPLPGMCPAPWGQFLSHPSILSLYALSVEAFPQRFHIPSLVPLQTSISLCVFSMKHGGKTSSILVPMHP